jgi:hypothetical protein
LIRHHEIVHRPHQLGGILSLEPEEETRLLHVRFHQAIAERARKLA